VKTAQKIKIRVQLRDYLTSINVTSYMLGKWVDGVSSQTIYAVASGTRRPSLEVLEAILNGLRSQGHSTELSDIVQIEEASSEKNSD